LVYFFFLYIFRSIKYYFKKISFIKSYNTLVRDNIIDEEYVQQFFVGLLEEDGSISVNSRGKNRNITWVRFQISLKNSPENVIILNKIKEVVGGRAIIERKDKYVTWLAYKKEELNNILKIISKYPLLTSKKQCQLEFAKNCILNPSKDYCIRNKGKMYDNREMYAKMWNSNKLFPPYFSS
jgi:hypothetical protein